MKSKPSNFDVPAIQIWSSYILIGIYFLILGYIMIDTKFKPQGIILIIVSAVTALYHFFTLKYPRPLLLSGWSPPSLLGSLSGRYFSLA